MASVPATTNTHADIPTDPEAVIGLVDNATTNNVEATNSSVEIVVILLLLLFHIMRWQIFQFP